MKSPRSPRPRWYLVAALAALGLAVTACGSSDPGASGKAGSTSINFSLGYGADSLFAPMYYAEGKGLYEAEGLQVRIQPSGGTAQVLTRIEAGQAQLGVADSSSVIKAIADQDTPVIIIAVLLDHSPSVTATQKSSGITDIAGLKGKSLGDSPAGGMWQRTPALLGANGLTVADIKRVPINQGVNSALLAGKVDAVNNYAETFAGSADKLNLIPWFEQGVDPVGDVLIVNKDWAKKNPDAVRAFVKATMTGLQKSIADPATAAEVLAKAAQSTDPGYFSDGIELLEPFWTTSGTTTSERWAATQELNVKYLGQTKTLTEDQIFTAEYLPK
ncbi:MAG: ABC transporter substrate-binding protein [Nocardioidaceae bacterium]|nr:ABC transporter substrate-binding protein [Nocardioidaceae bacterium]